MTARSRAVLLAFAGLAAALAALAVLQPPPLVDAWPFPDTTPMSFLLMAARLAAAAASTGWCALAARPRAMSGIALDIIVIFIPAAAFVGWLAVSRGDPAMALVALIAGVTAAIGIAILRWSSRQPFIDQRPMPAAVRGSFAVFIVALLAVGGLLVVGVPNVLPWSVGPDLSVLFGLMFLGAAAYFAYGLARPVWENAAGQLAGFLVYDLVLALPLISRLPTVDETFRTSLVAYLAVILASAVLAAWFLFVRRETRLGGAAPMSGE